MEVKTESKLKSVIDWLNKNYSQDNPENYNVFYGPREEVIRYDDETAISLWGCGAIVCIINQIYFISEDDGDWFMESHEEKLWGDDDDPCKVYAYQTGFSVGWLDSFGDAMKRLSEYTKEHGEPVYYSGIEPKRICYYKLGKNKEE